MKTIAGIFTPLREQCHAFVEVCVKESSKENCVPPIWQSKEWTENASYKKLTLLTPVYGLHDTLYFCGPCNFNLTAMFMKVSTFEPFLGVKSILNDSTSGDIPRHSKRREAFRVGL